MVNFLFIVWLYFAFLGLFYFGLFVSPFELFSLALFINWLSFNLKTFLHAQNSASCGSYFFLLVLNRKGHSLLIEVRQHLVGFHIVHDRNIKFCPPEGSSGVCKAVDSLGVARRFGPVSNRVDSGLNILKSDRLYLTCQSLRSSFGFLYHHLFIIIDYEGRELSALRFRVNSNPCRKIYIELAKKKENPDPATFK